MDFEIITFEYSDLYDGKYRVSAEEVVQAFMKQYVEHLSPEYYPEDEICFDRGRLWLSYVDKTGGDKPKHVMLIGQITDELVAEIQAAVSKLYLKNCGARCARATPPAPPRCSCCWDCGKELPKDLSSNWALCLTCREL